jgi:hypothetical protein
MNGEGNLSENSKLWGSLYGPSSFSELSAKFPKESAAIFKTDQEISSAYLAVTRDARENNKNFFIENRTFQEFSSSSFDFLADKQSVWLPADACLVDPKLKGIVEENNAEYSVKFHSNEYKRLLLWCLSHGVDVHLYHP